MVRLVIPFTAPSAFSIYSLIPEKEQSMNTQFSGIQDNLSENLPVNAMADTVHIDRTTQISIKWLVWLAGLCLCAGYFLIVYRKLYREFQMSFLVKIPQIEQWLVLHNGKRRIEIRQSDRVAAPVSYGIIHPIILFPKNTDWENMNVLQYVLEHEYVHIKRYDSITKLLVTAIVCIHWFNPMVWVMYILFNRDLELACDECVIHRFGNNSKSTYAHTLISMEEQKSGFMPFCNNFSKNAIEERITAIMKTKKTTIISFVLAAVLITGTAAAFATSAQAEADNGDRATAAYGTNIQPDAELLAIGLTYQDSTWFYQGKAVAGMYDDNGGTYTNDAAAGDIYLAIKRGSDGKVTELAPITKKQFTELVDRHLNDVETEVGESSLMSYVDPTDGKTYYSFDDGKTFEPMTDEEFEARFPTPNVEWWTYDEYKAWLDNEKVQLQSLLGKTDTIGGQKFTWTQEEIDKTIAMYEETLSDIKNGIMYSKSVDGDYQLIMSYNPADISTSTDEKGLYIKLDNGKEYTFGPYETDEALLAAVKPFCEKQVRLGNMTQSEADEIIARHSGK